jgi:hypothetical protein
MFHLKLVVTVVLFGLIFVLPSELDSQELEPRAQAGTPVRLNTLLLVYSYSSGNILLDPALPVEDAEAGVHTISLAYVTTFNLFGRLGKLDVVVPFSHGNWEGLLEGEPASATRNGIGDPLFRIGVNLIGTPALYGRDFSSHREKFVTGFSLQVRVPLGQYDGEKLVNLGSNRWMFRPTLGMNLNVGRWVVESVASAWFFTTNDNFYGGNTLYQRPMYGIQFHVAYKFRVGFWGAVSYGRTWGGKTVTSGEELDNFQKNGRFGATLAVPLGRGHAVSLSYTAGVTTRYGADFDTFALGYRYSWGGFGDLRRKKND